MKTKKTIWLLLAITLLGITIIISGCKKDDEPDPAQEKKVWAVGFADNTNYGTIMYSANGGETWIRQGGDSEALLGINISDVWAVDENTVWAVGYHNTILKTTDGGHNWESVQAPNKNVIPDLSSISIVSNNNIWISGSNGAVYNSTDGGATWNSIESDYLSDKYIQGIHAASTDVIYTTGGYTEGAPRGFIARTVDAGQTWDSIVPANDFNKHLWIGIKSSDINNVVVYGGNSQYIHTIDGGQNWKNDSVPSAGGGGLGDDLNCLTMLDANIWWGAFDLDGIYITEDAGNTWQNNGPAPPPGNMWLLGISAYDRDLCVIVGSSESSNNGKIVRTIDGGKIWETVYETNAWMNKVSFVK